MYMCMDATTGWSFLYFMVVVFLGSFFLLNLALGVITEVYEETDLELERIKAIEQEEEKRNQVKELEKLGMTMDDIKVEEQGDDKNIKITGPISLCRYMIAQQWFSSLIMFMIVLNTIVLAMEYYGMSPVYSAFVGLTNVVLTFIFLAEMVIKLVALGPRNYVKDRFNIFDAVVVFFSIIEVFLGWFTVSSAGGLSAFRAFRILRVLKLVHSWKSLRCFITVLFGTMKELGNFFLIVLLIVFIFCLLGMQLFGGKLNVDGEVPRANFDTLVWSAVAVFQVLTGEDWNQIMYDCVNGTNAWSALYFVTLIVIGDFMILNLFIAILLANFSNPKGDEEAAEEADEGQNVNGNTMLGLALHGLAWFSECTWFPCRRRQRALPEAAEPVSNSDPDPQAKAEPGNELEGASSHERPGDGSASSSQMTQSFSRIGRQLSNKYKGAQDFGLESHTKNALFFLSPENSFRKLLFAIADDRRFDWCMIFLILSSSISIAVETPWMGQTKTNAMFTADIVFTTLFAVEMIIKILALGFVRDKHSYLRDSWNVLDFFVVIFSVLAILLRDSSLYWIKAFRSIRMLRPLRVINRIPELKVVVNAMFASLPGLWNVTIVSLLFWIVFGILGMQLFLGTFFYCDNPTCCAPLDNSTTSLNYQTCSSEFWESAAVNQALPIQDNTTICCVDANDLCCQVWEKEQCIGSDCRWLNADMNFDNIFKSMMTLFEMCTSEGWAQVMYQGVDAVGIGFQPQRDHRVVMVLYFISFMIIGYFFIINLFVGIILDKFSEEHKSGNPLLTKDQGRWVDTQLKEMTKPLKPDTKAADNPYRKFMFHIVTSKQFDLFIMMCIIINVIFMAMEHYQQSKTWDIVQNSANIFFSVIFTIEAACKIFALGIKGYFASAGNIFDFILVLTSVISLSVSSGVGLNFIRIFRIARAFRLIKSLKGLRILFTALVVSVPTMINVAGLFFLLLFMYAVLGVNLFGRVKFGAELDRHANFRNFGIALLTLIRVITGEAWNGIMYDCMVQPPDCDPSNSPYCALLGPTGELQWNTSASGQLSTVQAPGVTDQAACTCLDCQWRQEYDIDQCGTQIAPFYFTSFYILGSFIMLNLIIAVVLENFSNSKKSGEGTVSEEDFKKLRKAWKNFDPEATGSIALADLPRLISRTPPPLGLAGEEITRMKMMLFQHDLQVHPDNGRVFWPDVLHALFQRISTLQNIDEAGLPPDVMEQLTKARRTAGMLTKSELPQNTSPLKLNGQALTVGDAYRITVVQAMVRGMLARSRMKQMQKQNSQQQQSQLALSISGHIASLLDGAQAIHGRSTLRRMTTETPRSSAQEPGFQRNAKSMPVESPGKKSPAMLESYPSAAGSSEESSEFSAITESSAGDSGNGGHKAVLFLDVPPFDRAEGEEESAGGAKDGASLQTSTLLSPTSASMMDRTLRKLQSAGVSPVPTRLLSFQARKNLLIGSLSGKVVGGGGELMASSPCGSAKVLRGAAATLGPGTPEGLSSIAYWRRMSRMDGAPAASVPLSPLSHRIQQQHATLAPLKMAELVASRKGSGAAEDTLRSRLGASLYNEEDFRQL